MVPIGYHRGQSVYIGSDRVFAWWNSAPTTQIGSGEYLSVPVVDTQERLWYAPRRTIMEKKLQRIIIPGEPIPKGRPRMAVTKRGTRITYTPERSNQFAERVEKWALTQKVKKMDGLLRVVIWFWIKKPKSWKVYDIDNLAKGILDPLNGIAWEDDKQIVDLLCFKRTDIADPSKL